MSINTISNMFRSQKVSASALKVGRRWMDILSNNIANSNTVDTGLKSKEGNFIPYARQVPVFQKVLSEKFQENRVNKDVLDGVKVDEIIHVKGNEKKMYDPNHPAARKAGTKDAGYVYYPGVSVSQEMADMKIAAMFYEANVTSISVANKMMDQALSLGRN